MLAELLHRPFHGSYARIVDAGAPLTVEAPEHDEVLEVPVDDGRLLAFQRLGRHTEALGIKTVVTGSLQNHLRR